MLLGRVKGETVFLIDGILSYTLRITKPVEIENSLSIVWFYNAVLITLSVSRIVTNWFRKSEPKLLLGIFLALKILNLGN